MAARQRLQSGGVALQRLAAPGLGDWRRWRRPTTETTQTAVGVSVERAVEPEHTYIFKRAEKNVSSLFRAQISNRDQNLKTRRNLNVQPKRGVFYVVGFIPNPLVVCSPF